MTPLAESIPDPPRRVRWRTCLLSRWISGLLGGVLTVIASFMWFVALASGTGGLPFEDGVLDEKGWTTTGTLTNKIEYAESASGSVWRLEYEFEVVVDGRARQYTGASFSGFRPQYSPGSSCTVEYHREDPEISRIRDTKAVYIDPNVTAMVSVLLLPGVVLLYRWLRQAFRLRVMLREGRLSTAQIIESQLVRWVNPSLVKTQFRFEDERGLETIATQWLIASSRLGRHLLQATPRENPVIHAEDDPQLCYLVSAADFLPVEELR